MCVSVSGVSVPFHVAVSDIEMGMAIVVRGISENSKALQDGLKVGDEIREVNRVKGTAAHITSYYFEI